MTGKVTVKENTILFTGTIKPHYSKKLASRASLPNPGASKHTGDLSK
jgi:hypothetical protein